MPPRRYSLTSCYKLYQNKKHKIIPKDLGSYSIIQNPDIVTPIRHVPDRIKKPCYYNSGIVSTPVPEYVEIKNENEIAKMRDSCQLASSILKSVKDKLQVGTTTDDIDAFVHEECIKNNSYPSTLFYRGFPKSCCTSVNNVVCHGIPDLRPLEYGDMITVDITVFYEGYHGDCSKTFVVGSPTLDLQGEKLLRALEESLEKAICVCHPGSDLSEIGKVINQTATKRTCTVIPCIAGHGIGSYFHGPPDIFHSVNRIRGKMQPGMTFTIEPALVIGQEHVCKHDDGWTVLTVDSGRSAQMEHTVLITENGCEVLTK